MIKERIYKCFGGGITCTSCCITISAPRYTKNPRPDTEMLCDHCSNAPIMGELKERVLKYFNEEERKLLGRLIREDYGLFR